MPRSMSDVAVHRAVGPILGDEIQAALGRRLRDLYRAEPSEPTSTGILDLLDRLASAMPSSALDAVQGAPDPEVTSPSLRSRPGSPEDHGE